MHTIKKVATYEAKIYIGSRVGYEGEPFSLSDLKEAIKEYQTENTHSVRITPTTYFVKDYEEEGWEIAVINYPRFPKSEAAIYAFVYGLSVSLLKRFKQNRISFVTPGETVMLDSTSS
jgi:hypothetical protein